MFWIIATVELGRIEQLGGSSIVTRFRVFNGLPLYPIDSILIADDGRYTSKIIIPTVKRSMLAGYGRVWLPLLTACFGLAAFAETPIALLAALPLALASAYVLLFYGRLSPSEVRRRLAYAAWMGAPIDIGLIPEPAPHPHEASLLAFVDERAVSAPEGYREPRDADARWRITALESSDPELLVAALTRARWERRRLSGEAQAALDALHDALWAKLDPLLAAGKGPPTFTTWQRYVNEHDRKTAATAKQALALGGLTTGAVIAGAVVYAHVMSTPNLMIVNVSGADGLTVLVDGKPVAESLPTAQREGDSAFTKHLVSEGSHELVARDASGAEIDRRKIDIQKGTSALLYAPGRTPSTCFFEEIVTYASDDSLRSHEVVPLDLQGPTRSFPERIDYWFGGAPSEVEESKSRATVEKRTVRVAPCEAPKRR